MLGSDALGKLIILPFFHLIALMLALAGYNIPDFTALKSQLRSDTYSHYHGPLQTSVQYQESISKIQLEKDYQHKIIFHFNGDEACLSESLATPFAIPQLNQVSSFHFHPSTSPRAPPVA